MTRMTSNRLKRLKFIILALVAVTLASSTAWGATPPRAKTASNMRIVRLGLVDGNLVIGHQVRPRLQRSKAQRLELPQLLGCSLHLAHGVPQGSPSSVFRASIVGSDGRSRLAHSETSTSGSAQWASTHIEIDGQNDVAIVLTSSTASEGAWAQPYLSCPYESAAPPRYNVLLVSLGGLRSDALGSYRNDRSLTPALDHFAKQGTVFQYAYAHYPTPQGSHAAIFSGEYPASYRLNQTGQQDIEGQENRLTTAFSSAGYSTAAFIENSAIAADSNFESGFDRYSVLTDISPQNSATDSAATTFGQGIQWLKSRPSAPFFLFLHAADAEQGTNTSVSTLPNGTLTTTSRTHVEKIRSAYEARVSALDTRVSQLLAALDKLGLASSTLVVLFSDHGEEFGEHGSVGHGTTLYEEALWVPAMLRLGGVVAPNRQLGARTGLIDLAPTVTELAGIEADFTQSPARSRAAQIAGHQKETAAPPVFSELSNTEESCEQGNSNIAKKCQSSVIAVRDQDYTYIHYGSSGRQELFAFPSDAIGRRNLAESERGITARFRQQVQAYKERTQLRILSENLEGARTPDPSE
jgi:arylsulfatase A-like enzyme